VNRETPKRGVAHLFSLAARDLVKQIYPRLCPGRYGLQPARSPEVPKIRAFGTKGPCGLIFSASSAVNSFFPNLCISVHALGVVEGFIFSCGFLRFGPEISVSLRPPRPLRWNSVVEFICVHLWLRFSFRVVAFRRAQTSPDHPAAGRARLPSPCFGRYGLQPVRIGVLRFRGFSP